MKQDIFETLKEYSKGFHSAAPLEAIRVYDVKIAELTARIKADVPHAPEIIHEEIAKYEVNRYRAAFTKGALGIMESDAEWKAIDNIIMALTDSTPLKQ